MEKGYTGRMKNFFFGGSEPKEDPKTSGGDARIGRDSFFTGDDLRDQNNVKLLLEVIGDVTSTLSLEKVQEDVVDKSIELARAERGILLLVEQDKIRVKVARDADRREIPKPVQYSTTLVLQVAKTKKSFRKMLSSDSEAINLGQSVFDLKLRAVMCAPLLVKDKLIGVIYVDSRAANREFSRSDLNYFNALSQQLGIAIENARLLKDSVEKARLEQSVKIASEIQKGLLPEGQPHFPGTDIFGWYSPCEDATGDTYDFLALSEGRIGLVIADVSGHGVGPALLSATARAALRSYLNVVPDLARVVDYLQADLQRDMKPGMFLTMFLGIFDTKSRTLQYLNAGHPSPVLFRREKGACLLDGFEPAFGFREGVKAESLSLKLEAGDGIVAYTDGLAEARSPDGKLYGEERLREFVERSADLGAQRLVEGLVADVLGHANQCRADDLTLFAMRVTD